MNNNHASYSTRLKVGIFALLGILLIGAITILVNNRPFWWRPCQLVQINVEDATGLKTKSPIRSLGIEIGYLKDVILKESRVTLRICLTAPVEVLPTTRAYLRGEGFLGDKFVELKPIKYLQGNPKPSRSPGIGPNPQEDEDDGEDESQLESNPLIKFATLLDSWIPSAHAEESQPVTEVKMEQETPGRPVGRKPAKRRSRHGQEIPVGEESEDIQHLVNRVDDLIQQMSGLTSNLKEAINPGDMQRTMKQLNVTLEHASRTLAPEGGLTQTAQRSLAKLEDAIEQLRDQLTRINNGKGSLGSLLNDPKYADELMQAIRNINRLLNRVGEVRFIVDLGATQITAYNSGRAWLQLGIWPRPNRYYLLGIATDPRGRISNTITTTTAGGISQTTQTQTVEQTSILITGMFGHLFFDNRLDLSVGALYGDGAASVALRLGPNGNEEMLVLRDDVYVRNSGSSSVDTRIALTLKPYSSVYLRAGIESIRGYNGGSQIPLFFGAGLSFDDEDIKLLFSLK